MDMHYQGGSLQNWTGLIIMVGSITFAQIAYRKLNDGYLNLSEAMKIGLGVTVIGILIAIVYGWFQATILDPTQIERATEFAINQAIDQNPEIAKQNFVDAKKFLAKILDKGSVNKASMWFIDAEKLYCLYKKDFIGYKNLQLDYLNRLKIDFSEESTEFDKACVNIANDLEWHTEHSPNCPDFFNDCIVIWKKALNYFLSQNKDLEEFDNKTKQLLRSTSGVTYSQLAQRNQKLSSLYLKKNSLKNALNYNSKALDFHKKNFEYRAPEKWDFIDGELIPLSKDTKELFTESETDTIVGYG